MTEAEYQTEINRAWRLYETAPNKTVARIHWADIQDLKKRQGWLRDEVHLQETRSS